MKQYWLMFGQTGARLAHTLLLLLSAGFCPSDSFQLLLCDTDARSELGLRALQMAEHYRQVHAQQTAPPCATPLSLARWPEALAEGGIAAFSDGSESDRLLLQAFFTPQEQKDSLRGGFRGPGEVAEAVMAHLMAADPEDALHRLLREMQESAATEPIRVVLCGCAEGGMGCAGLRQTAALLASSLPEALAQGSLQALVGFPAADPEEALQQVSVLLPGDFRAMLSLENLEQASRCSAWDLLAVWQGLCGLTEARWILEGPEGAFTWQAFGDSAREARLSLGRLVKTAAAFPELAGTIDSLLQNPGFLRDRMQGWYRAYFRAGRGHSLSEETPALLHSISALMQDCSAVLREMDQSLPPRWRFAAGIQAAYQAADAHYADLLELAAQAEVMAREARESGLMEEQVVHRHGMEETEAETTLRRLEALRREVEARTEAQQALQRRIGHRMTLTLLRRREKQCRLEADRLRGEAEEADRRIEEAAQIAKPEDMYRVDTARTKLQRMRRRVAMLEAKTRLCQQDRRRLADVPFEPDPDWARNPWLLREDALAVCLSGERRQLEEAWPQLIEGDTLSLQAVLRSLPGLRGKSAPAATFFSDLYTLSMREAR